VRLDHPIFHTPLAAGIELVDHDWERDYDGRGVWVVQTGEVGKEVDYGVVSDGHGFEDSPDCERISGGVNSKGPHAVAIGRQANMLQWGFYAAPDRMTESAKKAFLNALVYMQRFDGEVPLVTKVSRARGWLEQYITMVSGLDGMEEDSRARYRTFVEGSFPAGVIEEHGYDAAALERWRASNVEYVCYEGNRHAIDTELSSLGVSNRSQEFLELVEARLSADPADPVALRLARRYLPVESTRASDAAAKALAWIREHRAHAFFSDVGGYRWFADTRPVAAVGAMENKRADEGDQ
jgi:hypothetical protein